MTASLRLTLPKWQPAKMAGRQIPDLTLNLILDLIPDLNTDLIPDLIITVNLAIFQKQFRRVARTHARTLRVEHTGRRYRMGL